VAVMKGCANAATREFETAITTAWHGEAFARTQKLKGLSEYLPRDVKAEKPAVRPEVILDAMLTMQAHGVPMQVRKIDKGE
jgi:hypothetical protein